MMGKFHKGPFRRWSRKQSPGAYDRGAKEENCKFAGWEGGQVLKRADDEEQGGGMQSGQASRQVWEPWMQNYFQRKLIQPRQLQAISRKDNFGFLRRRQSCSLRRYFQSSPRNPASPRLNGYTQLSPGQGSSLGARRPPLGTITNTPKRFGPKTTNALKMMKSVVKDKTPSNILKRLQGNMRVQLGKAKRLFKGSTRDTQGESLSQVLTMESVELGLRLESYLQMPGQLKRGASDDEGEWEEVKVMRPYRKVKEEVEDLMSPDWREMKEVS